MSLATAVLALLGALLAGAALDGLLRRVPSPWSRSRWVMG